MQIVQDDWQDQVVSVAICLIIFGALLYILFIIKVKILVLIKCSYKSLQSC